MVGIKREDRCKSGAIPVAVSDIPVRQKVDDGIALKKHHCPAVGGMGRI
jgi:hypothetical protein